MQMVNEKMWGEETKEIVLVESLKDLRDKKKCGSMLDLWGNSKIKAEERWCLKGR